MAPNHDEFLKEVRKKNNSFYKKTLKDWKSSDVVAGLRFIKGRLTCKCATRLEGCYRLDDAPKTFPPAKCDLDVCTCTYQAIFTDETDGVIWEKPF